MFRGVLQNWVEVFRPVWPIWPKLYVRWRCLVGGNEITQLVGIETQVNCPGQPILAVFIQLLQWHFWQAFLSWQHWKMFSKPQWHFGIIWRWWSLNIIPTVSVGINIPSLDSDNVQSMPRLQCPAFGDIHFRDNVLELWTQCLMLCCSWSVSSPCGQGTVPLLGGISRFWSVYFKYVHLTMTYQNTTRLNNQENTFCFSNSLSVHSIWEFLLQFCTWIMVM